MKRVNWKAWVGTLGGLGIGLGSVLGQSTPPAARPQLPPIMTTKPANPASTAKPGNALQTGIDLYQKGDYESAQPWLGQANLNRASLTPADQKKLDEFIKKNDDAIKQRTAAIHQLAKASEMVSTGKYGEADSMVKSLKSSKWLKADEQQHVAYLSDMIKKNNPPKSSGLFPPKGDKPKGPDPDELLEQARKAFEQNSLDLAESLAKQSETAGFRTFNLFADTPTKVLKDVETAKKKAAAAPAPNADAKNAAAKALLKQAHDAVVANDLAKAKKLLKDAEEMKPTIGYWEEHTLEKVKNEIAKAEKAAAVKPPVTDKQPPKPPVADKKKDDKKDETVKTAAETKELVKAARQALNEDKLDQAEEMAKQARKANFKFGTFEDSPDKVLADVLKARDVSDYGQAAKLLDEARKKFEANQLDEAEKLTWKAEQLRKSYPVWYRGERPDKLRAEITTKRRLAGKPKFPELDPNNDSKKPDPKDPVVKDPIVKDPVKPVEKADPRRPDALQQLTLARQHIQKGDLGAAWEVAAKVQKLNVAFKPGDETPDDIFRAVEAIQASQHAKKEPQMAELARQKALKCLGDARFLMKEGKLTDAMQCVQDAKTHKAMYKTGDDTPDACVAELQGMCQKQIEIYTEAGVTLQKSERHAEAMKYFEYVFNLEKAFQIDTHAVAQLMDQTRKQMAGKTPAPVDNLGEGQKLLAEAEKELIRGEIIKSRQLAEAVYLGNFNMKYQAVELLKKIDKKEEQLAKKKSMQFYDIGVSAFKRKDFASAAQYLQNLDMRLLDEAKRSHAQEMLASSEMQPFALKTVAGKGSDDPPGKVVIEPDPTKPNPPGMLSEFQKKQVIARDAARVQVLQASQEANRLAAKGDLDSAVRMLESSRASLRESGIDAELLAPLFRQLDDRLRVYSQMREQVALNNIKKQSDTKNLDVLKEKQRQAEHKKDVVGKYMAAYQTFIKEGKFKDAEIQAMLAREVDPDDPVIEAAAFKAQMMRRASEDRTNTNAAENDFNQKMLDTASGSRYAPSDENPMMFDPKRWNEVKKRGGRISAPLREPSPKDKESAGKLKASIDVNFENKPLKKVLDDLNELSGVNFWLDVQSISNDGISVEQPVTCRLGKVPVSTALDLILRGCKLTYHIQNGVVIVTTPLGASGQLARRVYPVADLIIPIDNYANVGGSLPGSLAALPKAGAESVMSNGNKSPWTIQDGTAVSSPGGGHATQPPGKAARLVGQHLDDLLIKLITDTIEPNSWASHGGQGVIEYYPLGHQLVVSQTENIQELIELLLNRLRELQEVQVTVEVRLVQLSESFYERIGLDMDIRIGTDQTNFFDKIVGSNPDVPAGFINKNQHLENIIVGLTPTGTFTTDLDIPLNVSSFNRAIPPFGGFPNTPGNNGGIDIGLAFLSDIEVFLFLEAAQGDRRTNVSQAPKISLYNGQTANLTLTDTQLFTTNVTASVVNGQVVFTPVITPLQNGLQMNVNAVVSADRRYVRLAIQPVIQSVAPEVPLFPITVFITPVIADDIAGTPVPFQQFIQQPSQTTQTILTTVNVPDGGTVLMGGLKTLSEGRNEFGPPILSKIPYISRFFRNVGYGREARSLMFMVTPRIIIQEEEEERLGNTYAF